MKSFLKVLALAIALTLPASAVPITHADRVKDTTTSTGSPFTLSGSAPTGFRTFASQFSTVTPDYFTCAIVGVTVATEWEIGRCHISASTTLVFDELYSSSTGSTVTFSAGTKSVFETLSAAEAMAVRGLKSATTTVDVAAATAPSVGQVLTATGATAATWQAVASATPVLFFGDGSDGDVTISSGTTTMTRDMYYSSLTMSGTGLLVTAGFRVFVSGTLTASASAANAISNKGAAASGTTLGAGAAAGSVGGGSAGSANGAGTTSSPCNGGAGGAAPGVGTGGTCTLPMFVRNTTVHLLRGAALLGGGGGGGSDNGANDGAGGGGGGVLAIYASNIVLGGTAPVFAAGGGVGGNGAAGAGGGGGGGGGGWVHIIYATTSGTTAGSVSCAGGNGGDATTGGFVAGTGGTGGTASMSNITTGAVTSVAGSVGSAPVGTTGGIGGVCSGTL